MIEQSQISYIPLAVADKNIWDIVNLRISIWFMIISGR